MNMDLISTSLSYMLVYATPIMLASLGETVAEKAGILNLGIEGIMAVGAASGFVASVTTGSPLAGLMAAMTAGFLLGVLHGAMVDLARANQIVSGLAIAIAGLGLANLIGSGYVGVGGIGLEYRVRINILDRSPFLRWLNGHSILTYTGILLSLVLWFIMSRTAYGLFLKAVGENPSAARAAGINVIRVRLIATSFGGMLAGLAGAYLSLVEYTGWFDNMTAGRGWLALGVVILGAWRPLGALLASLFVGYMMTLPYMAGKLGIHVNANLLQMTPYIAVVAALAAAYALGGERRLGAPSYLGRSIED